MGVYLFTKPHIIKNYSRLLSEEHQYWRKKFLLKIFIKDNKSDLTNDESVENFGNHTIWKGLDSHCSGVGNVSPSIFSISLRSGWTISGAKEIYLKYESSGY